MTDNKAKGDQYEQYILDYLYRQYPEYKSYLWKDVPEQVLYEADIITDYNKHRLARKNNNKINPLQDIGIDILVEYSDTKVSGVESDSSNTNFIFVQCKNYTNTVCVNDLGGFFMMMLNHIHKGIVYYTSKLSRHIEEICSSNKRLEFVKKEMLVDERGIKTTPLSNPECISLPIPSTKIELFSYQKEVIDKYTEYYKTEWKSILSLPCGLGKTLMSCYIAMLHNIVVFITPLKQFAEQNITRFNQYEPDRPTLLIDSDGTRDIDEIERFIADSLEGNKKCMLSATYKSCDVISTIFCKQTSKPHKAFIIIDEFHNLSKVNVFDKKDCINKIINCDDNKLLFMSATPRIYELENVEDEKVDLDVKDEKVDMDEVKDVESDVDECDMDEDNESDEDVDIDANEVHDLSNEEIQDMFGKTLYHMSFQQAIASNYISDYKLYIPVNIGNQYNELKDDIKREVKLDDLIDSDLERKCCFLYESIKQLGKLRCILYFRNTKEIDSFIEVFNKLNEYYAYEYKINKITYKNTKEERTTILNEFSTYPNSYFLCSVSILDECIDLPSCDSVYITYPVKSKILTVQRVCRALRKLPGKIANILVYCNELDDQLEVLSALKEVDNKFYDKVNYTSLNKGVNKRKVLIEEKKKFDNDYKKVLVGVKEYKSDNWFEMLNKVKKYIEEKGEHPKLKSAKDLHSKKLAQWLVNNKNYYTLGRSYMKNKEIFTKWQEFMSEYPSIFLSNDIKWYNMLKKIEFYILEHKSLPSQKSKILDIKKMGRWITQQKLNYRKEKDIMKIPEIRKVWEDFKKTHSNIFLTNIESWYVKLNNLEKWILENKKLPSSRNQDGKFMHQTNQNYKNKKDIMKNQEIRTVWENFKKKHTRYFISKEEKWVNRLKQVNDYLLEFKRLPNDKHEDKEIKKLSIWIDEQKKRYRQGIHIMKNPEIKAKWEEFIKQYSNIPFEYKEKYQINKEIWYSHLNDLINYINLHDKLPNAKTILGAWVGAQKKNVKQNRDSMKIEELRATWDDTIKKYPHLFMTFEDIWYSNLAEVEAYIIEYNKRPSSESKDENVKKLGRWVKMQTGNYSKHARTMKDETIRETWREFTSKYSTLFLTDKETWYNNLKKTEDYISQHSRLPYYKTEICRWIYNQKKNYKQNKNIMKDESIRSAWEALINKYPHLFN
jgi:superfamily II DNA or RNA helicase